jgi:hypothetical protein
MHVTDAKFTTPFSLKKIENWFSNFSFEQIANEIYFLTRLQIINLILNPLTTVSDESDSLMSQKLISLTTKSPRQHN